MSGVFVAIGSAASLLVFDVTAERAGGGEFAQLVAHHLLGHVDGHVGLAVVDGNGVADHHRQDGGGPRPGLDHGLVVGSVLPLDLAEQAVGDERAFFE